MTVPAAELDADRVLTIAVLPGDGIGIEVMDAALAVLRQLQQRFPLLQLSLRHCSAGAAEYQRSGTAPPRKRCRPVAMQTPCCSVRWACPMFASRTDVK